MELLLQDYLRNNTAVSLSNKTGMSTQLISYLKLNGAANVYIEYDIKSERVDRVWSEAVQDYYKRVGEGNEQ